MSFCGITMNILSPVLGHLGQLHRKPVGRSFKIWGPRTLRGRALQLWPLEIGKCRAVRTVADIFSIRYPYENHYSVSLQPLIFSRLHQIGRTDRSQCLPLERHTKVDVMERISNQGERRNKKKKRFVTENSKLQTETDISDICHLIPEPCTWFQFRDKARSTSRGLDDPFCDSKPFQFDISLKLIAQRMNDLHWSSRGVAIRTVWLQESNVAKLKSNSCKMRWRHCLG